MVRNAFAKIPVASGRRALTVVVGLLVLAGGLAWVIDSADAADAKAELQKAIDRGAELYKKPWKTGAKTCAACHTRGPNKMSGKRADAYPKYDKALRKVVSLQQKLNQMIKSKSKGKPLDLGSEDLTALEAYVNSLK